MTSSTPTEPETGTVVSLSRRRSYLDAARDQGVHQEYEELLDETSKLRTTVAKQKLARGEKVDSAEVLDLLDKDPDGRRLHLALETQRDLIIGRFKAYCDAYSAAGLGDGWFPQLVHILFNAPSMKPEDATAFYVAVRQTIDQQSAPSTTPDHAEPRLNGEGLIGRIHRKDHQ
jgi:hypothetical protein